MADEIFEKKGRLTIPYRWSYGQALTGFFKATATDKQIMGATCTKCAKVIVPPLGLCGRCFAPTGKDWVKVSDRGTLITFTTVYLPFPGQPKEPPYTYGMIKLDGTDTFFAHLIEEIEAEEIYCGMRLEALWSEERKGDLYDILYFRPEASIASEPPKEAAKKERPKKKSETKKEKAPKEAKDAKKAKAGKKDKEKKETKKKATEKAKAKGAKKKING